MKKKEDSVLAAASDSIKNKEIKEMQAVRYTVMPGITSTIFMKVQPDLAFTLHQENEQAEKKGLRLYSDSNGNIHFNIHPPHHSDEISKLVLDSIHNATLFRYPVHLRFHHQPTEEMPAPPEKGPAKPDERMTRLSEKEISELSNAELLKRGYPARPDQTNSPQLYRAWLEIVSLPLDISQPSFAPMDWHANLFSAARRAHVNGNGNFGTTLASLPNGCGFELRSKNFDAYNNVKAKLQVPYLNDHVYGSACQFIVGFDSADTDLDSIQTGIGCLDSFNDNSGNYYFIYSAFVAALIDSVSNTHNIIGFPVLPGDIIHIYSTIYRYDSSVKFHSAFYNETQNIFRLVISDQYDKSKIQGKSVYWLVSRVKLLLANFGTVIMSEATANSVKSGREVGYLDYEGVNERIEITMVADDLRKIATVTPLGQNHMRFNWLNYN